MACSNWVDEDQPLRYRMGKVDIAGNKFPFDATLDTLKGMKLESGTITLYAEVLDSLDAVSEKVTDEVTISPATFRRRLLANSALDTSKHGPPNHDPSGLALDVSTRWAAAAPPQSTPLSRNCCP